MFMTRPRSRLILDGEWRTLPLTEPRSHSWEERPNSRRHHEGNPAMTDSISVTHPDRPLVFRTIHLPRTQRATGWPPVERVVTIIDARFPSGYARLLAWDVEVLGPYDFSSWLCRCDAGEYFVLQRPGNRLEAPHAVVHVSPEQASEWYARHGVHVGGWEDPRHIHSTSPPDAMPPTVAD